MFLERGFKIVGYSPDSFGPVLKVDPLDLNIKYNIWDKKQLQKIYDKYKVSYADFVKFSKSFKKRIKNITSLVQKVYKTGPILYFGAGLGFISQALINEGYTVVAQDIDKKVINILEKKEFLTSHKMC